MVFKANKKTILQIGDNFLSYSIIFYSFPEWHWIVFFFFLHFNVISSWADDQAHTLPKQETHKKILLISGHSFWMIVHCFAVLFDGYWMDRQNQNGRNWINLNEISVIKKNMRMSDDKNPSNSTYIVAGMKFRIKCFFVWIIDFLFQSTLSSHSMNKVK
jgi:hypothetical protein